MTEAERFEAAILAADQAPDGRGIGTLGQKTLHAVLKLYYEPDPAYHEVPVGRYVADIAGEGGIVEIQTRQLNRLRDKLEAFLPLGPVTVVYPLAHTRRLGWVEPATGEVISLRKSTKTGRSSDALPELYGLRAYLGHPNLRIRLPMVDMTELKFLNGYGPDRKRRATRCERIPLALWTELRLDTPADFQQLLPPTLPECFTAADFERAARLRGRKGWSALQVLLQTGVVRKTGKDGNRFLYAINKLT